MIGSAPAKIILFGEHAVVYGYPAIAAPISSLRVNAEAVANEKHGLRIYSETFSESGLKRIDLSVDDINDAFALTVKLTLQKLNRPAPNVDIKINSQIPVASGLGSGAAVSTAIARVLMKLSQASLPLEVLNTIIYETEKIHHSTPSGIDNTVIVYEKSISYIRDQPIQLLEINKPFHFVIADTGIPAPTKIAVDDVRQLIESEPQRYTPVLRTIGDIVEKAKLALASGNRVELGKLMTKNHNYLKELTVSSAQLDYLCQIAVNNGALGAKLSGGGRGGNMIALVTPETQNSVVNALKDAGAVHTFFTVVES